MDTRRRMWQMQQTMANNISLKGIVNPHHSYSLTALNNHVLWWLFWIPSCGQHKKDKSLIPSTIFSLFFFFSKSGHKRRQIKTLVFTTDNTHCPQRSCRERESGISWLVSVSLQVVSGYQYDSLPIGIEGLEIQPCPSLPTRSRKSKNSYCHSHKDTA